MTSTKDNNKRTKIPYEPPRLFDFGGGVAYAAAPCSPGGSPAGGVCSDGNTAIPSQCRAGSTAVKKCLGGNVVT
ncbi:MAG: hypothetical protein KAV87_29555 [Desulfobacteraceae bacterium]|nr:hypothetical protein [Desulfobacteraceae bacterium]